MLYLILSSLSDYHPDDIDLDEIIGKTDEELEDGEYEGVSWATGTLDELRAKAIEESGEWRASTMECLVENLWDDYESGDIDGAKGWRENLSEWLWATGTDLARIARMNPGDIVRDISCTNDIVWLIERD
jgi:hypothetical protein